MSIDILFVSACTCMCLLVGSCVRVFVCPCVCVCLCECLSINWSIHLLKKRKEIEMKKLHIKNELPYFAISQSQSIIAPIFYDVINQYQQWWVLQRKFSLAPATCKSDERMFVLFLSFFVCLLVLLVSYIVLSFRYLL